jgi:hypothetical protein
MVQNQLYFDPAGSLTHWSPQHRYLFNHYIRHQLNLLALSRLNLVYAPGVAVVAFGGTETMSKAGLATVFPVFNTGA